MSQEQLREAAQKALDALEEIALAGMSGTGQESEDGMRDWHARQAWKFIGIAARALDPIRQALATQPEQAKGSEVDELVSLLAACRDIAARLAPGVADDLLMHAVGGPSEVPAYIEGVISELTNPAPAASAEREARVIEQNARKAAQEQLYAERERHTAEVKRLQAEIGRLKAPAASVSDAVATVRERYRGTKWGKAAECICDAVDEAILALRPAQAGVQHFGWAYDFLDGVRIINDWVTSSKDEAFKPGHFNQRELLAAAPNE